jgi:hypothetical protein
LEITHRHITLGRTPLEEGSACCRGLYLTTYNIHKRQTSMPPARFEPAIPPSEGPQIYALDRAVTGIGQLYLFIGIKTIIVFFSKGRCFNPKWVIVRIYVTIKGSIK